MPFVVGYPGCRRHQEEYDAQREGADANSTEHAHTDELVTRLECTVSRHDYQEGEFVSESRSVALARAAGLVIGAGRLIVLGAERPWTKDRWIWGRRAVQSEVDQQME